ncbi:MAG: DUF1127 domain-containing protein [Paracoccaceae bacterium]
MSTLRLTAPLISHLRRTGSALIRLPARALGLAALARSRRRLIHLDDHLLRDIGLDRADALAEAARPLWDAPSHWKG